jgi:TonB-linked SusC/RagA family outer membrane protein
MKKSIYTLIIMLLGIANVFSQKQIEGTVVDMTNNETLIGVNVRVKGTSEGAVTGIDGRYNLTASEEDVLVFSFVGYVTEEVTIGTNTTIDIALAPDIQMLSEFVVVGYGTQRKSDLTGSVTAIKAEELMNVPSVGIDRALQGRVSGMVINASGGAPDASTTIRIRGMGSIFGSNDPLFVVDGVPLADGTKIENIVSPADVDRIDILKDASAAAIYGARGSNGVILITTKRGQSGAPVINFSTYSGFSNPIGAPNLADAEEYIRIALTTLENSGQSVDPFYTSREPGEWGVGTNWWNEILRSGGGRQQNYDFNISGGSEDFTYASSIGYYENKGYIKNSEYERINFSLNTDYKFLNYFQFGSNLRFTNMQRRGINENDAEGGAIAQAWQIPPTEQKWKTPEQLLAAYNAGYDTSKIWNQYASVDRTSNFNIARQLEQNNAVTKQNILFGQLFLQGEFFDHLTVRSEFALDVRRRDFYNYQPRFFSSATESNDQSQVNRDYRFDNNWVSNTNATWAQRLGRHNYSLMAGFSRDYFSWEDLRGQGRQTPSDDPSFWYLSSTTGDMLARGGAARHTMQSVMARAFYSYDDRYMITANIRRDGSSKFSAANNNRWGTFPSVSAGWNLHNEQFFQSLNADWVTSLKLRGAWGQIGNQNIPNNAYTPVLIATFTDRYAFGPEEEFQTAYRPGNNANPQVRWETQETINLGLDAELFRGKFQFLSEYFIRNSIDNLLVLPQPLYSGTPAYWANVGRIQNRGMEFAVNYMEYDKTFKYSFNANITFLQNEVFDLGLGNNSISSSPERAGATSITMVGQPIAMFYGYQILGVFQNEEQVQNHVNSEGQLLQPRAVPGDFIFADLAGGLDENGNPIPDGMINAEDRTFIGNPHPKAVYGGGFTLSYAGFELNVFMQGQYGNDIFMNQKYYNYKGIEGGFNQVSGLEEISWNGEGSTNTNPMLNPRSRNNNYRVSEWWLSDGSYARLKNVTLTYNIPKNWINYAGLSVAQIYVTGENLFTITNYEGVDPEIGAAGSSSLAIGIDRYTYPVARTFLVGARLTF